MFCTSNKTINYKRKGYVEGIHDKYHDNVEDEHKLKASNIEFKLPKPSYTVNTLVYLKEMFPNHQFDIVLGSDGFQNITKWKNSAFIIENYKFLIYKRPGFDVINEAGADVKIIEIIDPKLMPEKIKRSNSSSGYISILTNNTNSLNCYTLFSSSLGGNNVSFIEHTKNYYQTQSEQFVNIVRKVIKETIENNKIETTAEREEVFSLVMKGFDSKFDEDGWQVYISDIDSVSNPFVKELRQLFKIEFENTLSIYLTAKS
jgi:hypothetical protein